MLFSSWRVSSDALASNCRLILTAIEHGIITGRVVGLDTKVRLMV